MAHHIITDPVAEDHAADCDMLAERETHPEARRAWLQAASIWRLCPRLTRENSVEAEAVWWTAERVHARAVAVSKAWAGVLP